MITYAQMLLRDMSTRWNPRPQFLASDINPAAVQLAQLTAKENNVMTSVFTFLPTINS